MHSRLVSEGSVQYCPHPQSDSVLPIWVCSLPSHWVPFVNDLVVGKDMLAIHTKEGKVWKMDSQSCQFESQPLLLCEACYPGGRGFNSCDQGQLGVHRQHEAGGAGGGEGEEETEGEEERRYYGED